MGIMVVKRALNLVNNLSLVQARKIQDASATFIHLTIKKHINWKEKLTELTETFAFIYGYKILLFILTFIKETALSTLVQKFHRSFVQHYIYSQGGEHLYSPDEMETFCDSHAPGHFDIFHCLLTNQQFLHSVRPSDLADRVDQLDTTHKDGFSCK